MDLKQLEYFVRVAELGSFTRASIELNVAQPALSRQVRLLEVELRQNLLIRNGRGVTTTDGGKLLLEHARGVLYQMDRLREDLGRARGGLVGRVALGLPPSLSKALAVPLTRAFRERLPEASLALHEGLSVTMLESLLSGRLDMALLHNALPSPDIELHPLLTQRLYLVERLDPDAPDSPIDLRELAERPLVIPSRPNAIRMLVETELVNAGHRPTIAAEIDAVPAILDLVSDGIGFAVLPMNSVRQFGHPTLHRAREIVNPGISTRLWMAVSSRRPTTPTQRTAMELTERIARRVLADVV